jgi:hypothetical protein
MENMDQLHHRGAFDAQALRRVEGSQHYRASVRYATIPVVAGWDKDPPPARMRTPRPAPNCGKNRGLWMRLSAS